MAGAGKERWSSNTNKRKPLSMPDLGEGKGWRDRNAMHPPHLVLFAGFVEFQTMLLGSSDMCKFPLVIRGAGCVHHLDHSKASARTHLYLRHQAVPCTAGSCACSQSRLVQLSGRSSFQKEVAVMQWCHRHYFWGGWWWWPTRVCSRLGEPPRPPLAFTASSCKIEANMARWTQTST